MSGRGGNNYRPWRGRGNRGARGFRGSRRPYGYGPSNRHNYNDNRQNNWKKDEQFFRKGLTEKEIGITEYVSEHEGFNGIIKSRFSDFQVSEINEKGEIAKLTDLKPPEPPEDAEILEDEELLLNKYNVEILPMETWDRINKLVIGDGTDKDVVEVDVTGMSKEERTKIHDAVKKAFGDSIVGSTVTRDEKKYCSFVRYRKGVRIDNRVKWVWPGEYVHFILYKENCDTMEAASRIIKRLRMNASLKTSTIGYAGTKDRRAKTSQWFSLRKVDPRKIANSCKGLPDVLVGNFTFSNIHLKLGMLQGNRFRICLRNVTASDEVIDKACKLLQENGFINYYGLQRFGSRSSVPTPTVGLHLLKGNFEDAIKSILEERPGPLNAALRAFHTRGPAAALDCLPHRVTNAAAETRLLTALAQNPRDLTRAMDMVPRNTRLLYLHSYQSLIWNKVVSERLKRFACTPAVGDLVPVEDIEEETIDTPDDETEETEEQETDTDKKTTDKNQDKNVPKSLPDVKILTQADIDSYKYTIFDIVLPLPGNSVKYPPNMKDFYEELLVKDGLTLNMVHKMKSYRLSGGYRRVSARPTRVEWELVRYSAPLADLLASDADELRGNSVKTDPDGKYKALLLTMTLPTSCYATMALRELLRVDTSSETQAQQNDYHKTSDEKSGKNLSENASEKNDTPESDIQKSVTSENDIQKSATSENVSIEKRKGEDIGNGDCKKAKTDE